VAGTGLALVLEKVVELGLGPVPVRAFEPVVPVVLVPAQVPVAPGRFAAGSQLPVPPTARQTGLRYIE